MAAPLVLSAFKLLEKGLDVIFPDPTKKAEAKALLLAAEQAGDLQDLDAEVRQETERTTRHTNDMQSDSWLSKNIRPGTLIYLLIITTFLSLTDGNLQWTYVDIPATVDTVAIMKTWVFDIKASYIQLFTTLLVMFAGFYVVGRTGEKITKIVKGNK